jgi:hypothetical protein
MSRNFYALGHQDDDDPMYHLGKLSGGVFTWAMDRLRCEAVLAGLAEKHCKTCACVPVPEGADPESVIVDENGTLYTRMQFALQFVEATSEDRTLVGVEFS